MQGTGTVEARFRSTDGDCQLQISSDTDEGQDSILNFLSGTSGRGQIIYDHNTTAADQKMLFKTGDAAVTAMTIEGTGNVGIGTITPAQKLHIESSTNTSVLRLMETTGQDAIWDLRAAANNSFHISGSADGSTTVAYFTILDTGDIGINDTTPTYKLDVNGTFRTTGQANFNSNIVTADGVTIGVGSNEVWKFDDGTGIVTEGRVGIGTTNPGYILDVHISSSIDQGGIRSVELGTQAGSGSRLGWFVC